MRISELEDIGYLGASGTGTNSYLIINYDTDPAPVADDTNPPVTYRVALDELGRAIASDLKLVTYDSSNGNMLNTIASNGETYATPNVGQFATASDRTTINNIQAGYTDTNYPTTDPATSDWDKYYVKQVTNTNGTIAVTHSLFNPSLTLTDGTADNAPKIKTTVNGNESSDITLTKATTGVYGVTKLSNEINSTSEVLAATPKAVKSAIESLDITQITNTAGKTVATIDEADGKVSATFQDISILSSQISDKGTANCVATLDANGHVPSSQLPSYVDDVLEGTLATFPATGETGKIYVDTTTNTSYRWSGSQYTKVASDLSLGTTSSTAYRGDYGAAAYAHGVTNKGSAFTSGLYKITTNSEGHVTAATEVQKSDITGLGIPGSDTTYEMDGTYNSSTNKVATVSTVTGAISGLAPIASPAFTGSISLNRKAGTIAGTESIAVGNETAANGDQTVAFGRSTISNGDASFTCGSGLVAAGGNEFVIGSYNKLPAGAWQPNTAYVMDDYVVYQDKLYYCASPHTSAATFEEDTGWYHARKHLLTIGNGNNSSGRGNAFVVDIWGNAHLLGDLYVGCSDDSQGGNKVIAIPEPPTTDGTYTLQCSVASGVVTYNWVSTT